MASTPPASSADTPTPFADRLRDAIAERGLSLAQIHRRLNDAGSPVSATTLGYWRSGARHPEGAMSRAAIDELERILLLEPRTLSDLIQATRRTGQIASLGEPFSDAEIGRMVIETHERLNVAPQSWSREVSSMNVAYVRADGGVREYTSRSLVQVMTKTVSSVGIVFEVPISEEVAELPVAYAISGGQITGTYEHPTRFLIGARFVLDAPVTAPHSFLMEYGVHIPDGFAPERFAVHGLLRKSRELVVEVRFPPEVRPAWIHEVEEQEDGETVIPRTMSGSSIHAARRGFGPGRLGLRWGFDDDGEDG